MKRYVLHYEDIRCAALVYDTQAQMLKAIGRRGFEVNPQGGAFSLVWYEDKYAEVYFSRELLLLDYVSHEFFHVAYLFAIYAERGVKKLHRNQERYAYMHSELIRIFWNRVTGLKGDQAILFNKPLFEKNMTVAAHQTGGAHE